MSRAALVSFSAAPNTIIGTDLRAVVELVRAKRPPWTHQSCILAAPSDQPEWSALALMEGPHFVRRAHDQYVDAGASAVPTPVADSQSRRQK